MLILVAIGCRAVVDLPDVPIAGGSEQARAAVRRELERFDRWVGAGRLRLAEVAFTDLEEPKAGRYRGGPPRILLSDDLYLGRLPEIMRHELCHALDYAEGLLDEPVPELDTYGERVDGVDRELSQRGRGEALAQACETGPFGPAALAVPCAGEPRLAREVAAWMEREVWRGFEPPSESSPSGDPLAAVSLDPREAWEAFQVFPTVEPDRIAVSVQTEGDGFAITYVDVNTGASAPPADLGAMAEDLPPGRPPGRNFPAYGWPDGPGAAVALSTFPHLVEDAPRLLAWRDGAWSFVGDGCIPHADGRWQLFTADRRVWYAWGDGSTVAWTPLGDEGAEHVGER